MRYVDLSENFLGYSDAGKTPLATWCLMGSSSGAGWCPTATPLSGTVSKLTTLDISDNGFAGVRLGFFTALLRHACAPSVERAGNQLLCTGAACRAQR